jgi:hypothetical protein
MADPYPHDFSNGSAGITFCLPSRRRFIPNCWMLHADINEKGTEVQIHYTHSLVTLHGTNLENFHEYVSKFGVGWVRELPAMPRSTDPTVTRIEITEKTPE